MTEKELTRKYTIFNKKFFDGKLPANIPIVFADMSKAQDDGLCTTFHGQGMAPLHTIYLDSGLKDHGAVQQMLLLHEMAHAKLYPDGGHETKQADQAFNEEMIRLAFRGAFQGIW